MYKVRLLSMPSQSTDFGAIAKGTEIVVRQQGKKQNHNLGVQDSRLWPFQGSTWKNCMGYSAGEKRGLEELVDLQGSPPPSSRMGPSSQAGKPAWMNMELLTKLNTKEEYKS